MYQRFVVDNQYEDMRESFIGSGVYNTINIRCRPGGRPLISERRALPIVPMPAYCPVITAVN